jgi:hypothetical protein
MNKTKSCKFFQQGYCRFTDNECKFLHIHKDEYTSNLKGNPKKKNTESFEPNYQSPDIRVLVEVAGNKTNTNLSFQSKDIILIPDLFCNEHDLTIHNSLLDEMNNCGINKDKLWKLWHGDTHLIGNDSTKFKDKCPTFLKIIERIREYFGIDIKASRLNLYRDDKDYKPYHFDSAAIDEEKAKVQNITIGVSFGRTRRISFEDALEPKGHRRRIDIELPNGYTYVFCKDININWRHGVPAIKIDEQTNLSRVSIITWGYVNQLSV